METELVLSKECKQEQNLNVNKKRTKCEVWSRVVGYLRPTKNWNEGKLSEWGERKVFKLQ
jgi:ribonucleoside-triphosphate reductase